MKGIILLQRWRQLRQLHPVAQYLIAVATTIVAYGLYALIVVPRIEGGVKLVRAPALPTHSKPTHRLTPELERWLPAGSWELESSKFLETSQGTICFRDYQPRDNGVLEVFPFTMILKSSDPAVGQDRAPVILRASKRAELQFERRVTLTGNPGRILGGQLHGVVQLFQAPQPGDPDSGFQVWTQNVQLTATRVTTLEPVEFQMGPHRGQGRHLTLDLAHESPLEILKQDFSKIRGVRRLELAFVDALRLQLDGPAKNSAESATVPSATSGGILDVSCAGPFVFDFEALSASFEDSVVVRQLDAHGDSLRADRLQLIFNSLSPVDASEAASTAAGKLELRQLLAFGTPAKVQMPSRDVEATAAELEYDLQARQIRGRDPQAVVIRQARQTIKAPRLNYRLRDDGAMGTLQAAGPGEFTRTSSNEDGTFRTAAVRWNTQLTIEPVEGGKVVTLTDGALVQLDATTQIQGDRLQLLLSEIRRQQPAGAAADWDYQPAELRVDGQVIIETPEVFGRTPRLIARWLPFGELRPLEGRRAAHPNVRPLVETRYRFSAASDARPGQETSPVSPQPVPAGTEAPSFEIARPAFPDAPRAEREKRLEFTADELVASLQQVGNQTEVRQLDLVGSVRVDQAASDQSAPAWSLVGDRMSILPQGQDLFRISMFGNATVQGEQLELTGPELQLDQAGNRLWTNGAGVARLRPRPPAAEARVRSQTVDVRWEGGMIFDGEKIYFERAVRSESTERVADGGQTVLQTSSEGLSLVLDRPVNLQQLDTQPDTSDRIEIRQIVLVDQIPNSGRAFLASDIEGHSPVEFLKVSLDAEGTIRERQRVTVPRIVLDLESGDISATGPGELIQWKPNQGNSNGPPTFLGGRQSGVDSNPARLTCLHCRFDDGLTANAHRTELRVKGRVRTLYAPADSWESQLDPDAPRLPPGGTKITCQQVSISQWTPRGLEQPVSEILASENARILNAQFEATAERLSYSEQSDLLVIEGDSRQDANLWFQAQGAAKRDHLVAGKILYRPGDQWTQIEKVRNATLNQGR